MASLDHVCPDIHNREWELIVVRNLDFFCCVTHEANVAA